MRFLLDTNAVIAFTKGNVGIQTRMAQHAAADFGIPAIVLHELQYGALNSARPGQNLDTIDRLPFEIVELSPADATAAAEIRAELKPQGLPVGPYDLLIMGQARARRLTVITRNLREFTRVPELAVENWESA